MKEMQRRAAALVLAVALALGGVKAAALDNGASLPPMAEASEMPVASGTKTEKNGKATIDYSNTGDGYVMVQFTASTDKRLKVQVAKTTTYTYDLTPKTWTTFPFSEGDGTYKVTVFENTSGTKYATVLSASIKVTLSDEFAPFLRPNQYVDYSVAEDAVAKAAELMGELDADADPLQKVGKVYDFVVKNLTYDKQKASDVTAGKLTGYLPVLDDVLEAGTGICFDYASLMAGMLRSQGIPCKLVVGYAGKTYHAWISVWTEEAGWVEGAIYFDGTTWHRMDPTFASSGKGSATIMKFIGDGKNYTEKYLY